MSEIFNNLDMFNVVYSTFTSVLIKVIVIMFLLFTLIYIILVQIYFERLFRKHNFPGYYNKIPLYNLAVLLKIVSLPPMYVVLFLIPVVNFIFILYVNNKLCLLYKKPSKVFFQMIYMSPIAFDRFIPDPKKSEEARRRMELEKQRLEEIKRLEREKSMKESTPNLLSEEEYKELNKQLVENVEVDNIFKTPEKNRDDVVTYKAIDTKKLIESQKEGFEIEELISKPNNQKATPLESEHKFVPFGKDLEEVELESDDKVQNEREE